MIRLMKSNPSSTQLMKSIMMKINIKMVVNDEVCSKRIIYDQDEEKEISFYNLPMIDYLLSSIELSIIK